jgi:hypothetical protein
LGKWNTGYSTDPYNLINPWHKRRVDELIALQGQQIGERFTSLSVNYVSNEFASKYWQMSRDFTMPDGTTENLALSWGKNFKKPPTHLYDALPADVSTWISQNQGDLKDHAIRNWIDTDILGKNVDLYLYGDKVIHSVASFQFIHQATRVSFKWVQYGNTPQLGTVIGNDDTNSFVFNFIPADYNGSATLTSYNGEVLDYQFEIVSIDMYDNPVYIIKNSSGQLARLNRSNITPEYLQQATPAHLPISFSSRTSYDAFADGSQQQEDYHFQFGNQAELNQGGMRRVINSADIGPLLTYQPASQEYTIMSVSQPTSLFKFFTKLELMELNIMI